MIGYRFTGPARGDLFEIWEFIARDDIDAADRVIAGLEAAAEKLVAHPEMGRSRPVLAAPQIRFLSVGAYLLVSRAPERRSRSSACYTGRGISALSSARSSRAGLEQPLDAPLGVDVDALGRRVLG